MVNGSVKKTAHQWIAEGNGSFPITTVGTESGENGVFVGADEGGKVATRVDAGTVVAASSSPPLNDTKLPQIASKTTNNNVSTPFWERDIELLRDMRHPFAFWVSTKF
jgi:hypothetical protein